MIHRLYCETEEVYYTMLSCCVTVLKCCENFVGKILVHANEICVGNSGTADMLVFFLFKTIPYVVRKNIYVRSMLSMVVFLAVRPSLACTLWWFTRYSSCVVIISVLV